jgi:hypothetical protein
MTPSFRFWHPAPIKADPAMRKPKLKRRRCFQFFREIARITELLERRNYPPSLQNFDVRRSVSAGAF